MLKNVEILTLIQESLNLLYDSGYINKKLSASLSESIFGINSPLDSMSFVTFMTDLEERLTNKTNKDIFIVLSDLDEIFPNEKSLTVDMLTRYINILLSHYP